MIDRRYIFSILQCLKNQNSNWYDHPHYNTVLLWRGSNRGILIKWSKQELINVSSKEIYL